jgi:hypothetical protein
LSILVVPAAEATHNTPARGKTIKTDLVRAYAECTAPNDVHDKVTVWGSACSPAAPLSSYSFGPRGHGQVQIKLLPARSGIKYRFDLRDVRTAANAAAGGVVFKGRINMRLTDDGCSAAPSCTLETFKTIDVPCTGGRCVGTVLFPDILFVRGLGGAVEVTRIDVLDDAGNRFATQGILLN